VIGKVLRGERPDGLVRYLFGPGRREEHTDPHIIAGWRHPAELEPPVRPDGGRDFRRLNGLLRQPHAALGPRGYPQPVWHCVVRAAPEDRMLSDDEWAEVAADIMHRTGLAPLGQDDDAVRWIAIRHADDHIHIVAMLARQDGARPRVWNDFYRVREACRAAEDRYGLRRTAPGDRTAGSRPTRAETEKTRRRGWQEAPRITLRRAVITAAAGASSEEEFFARLREAGLLVRTRSSVTSPGQVTGYAVALPEDGARSGEPVWFGGGKLAADLSLPRLRRRWEGTSAEPQPDSGFTAAERSAIWEHAARVADAASQQIRAAADPAAAADAAWAVSDTLHVAAAALGSRTVRKAADAYARAARPPYARIPRRTSAGNSLRRAARLMSAAAFVRGDPALSQAAMVVRLAALAEAVADLRDVQHRAAQAAAARQAAAHLRRAATSPRLARPQQAHSQTATRLADASFPAAPSARRPAAAGARRSTAQRRPAAHRSGARPPQPPRGPGR
jgi:hypothetical protein